MKGPENKFRDSQVIPYLKKLGAYFFIKEAAAIRGIPDIIGCLNGYFFALELKSSYKEAIKNTGRIVLQQVVLDKMRLNSAYAEVVYPENFITAMENLRKHCA